MVIITILIMIFIGIGAYISPQKYSGMLMLSNVLIASFSGAINNKLFFIMSIYSFAEYLVTQKRIYYPTLLLILLVVLVGQNDVNYYEIALVLGIVIFSLIQVSLLNIRIYEVERKWDESREKIAQLDIEINSQRRYMEQEVLTLKLEERNELSGKMHDKIGHTLAGSLLQLEAAQLLIKKNENKKALGIVENVAELLRYGMDDIRKTLREIKPASEEIGINKIRLLLENKMKGTNFNYYLTSEGNTDLINRSQWEVIVDGIRELSTNTLKYSNGNKMNINLEVLNRIVKIEVRDNGLVSKKLVKGMGLQRLEERLINIGGNLVIDSSNGFTAIMILLVKGE